ncbi:MAG: YfiR family protein [Bacteroidota bacterium]
MNKVKFFLIGGLLSLATSFACAQDRPAHELHSMMIYNFLKYIEWPGAKNSGDFLVGVVGSDDVYNTLNTWYGNKTRGNKNFIIKKVSATDDLSEFQLVYIGKSGADEFEAIISKVGNKPILTVTAKNGFGKKGSCINFKVVDNRLKFELNQAAVKKTSLKTSSQLAEMAIII